jgi:hypothetical protein
MTLEQRITVSKLRAEGFTQCEDQSQSLVIMVRGNDRRVVWLDGSQHRAMGAKK